MSTVRKWALVLKLALLVEFPILAHFSLIFHLVLPDKTFFFLFILEFLLRLLYCCVILLTRILLLFLNLPLLLSLLLLLPTIPLIISWLLSQLLIWTLPLWLLPIFHVFLDLLVNGASSSFYCLGALHLFFKWLIILSRGKFEIPLYLLIFVLLPLFDIAST